MKHPSENPQIFEDFLSFSNNDVKVTIVFKAFSLSEECKLWEW